ncbi:MAG: hypothetical protein ACP5G5_06090 [Thermoplasmata archaeon]|jgi:cell division GTPase FtsZ|nr:MAG: hypothetical protein C0180_00715 [Aciduliprofundum sp.]HEU13098.1 hypothetical protein [Euryarchaeota archaeon]
MIDNEFIMRSLRKDLLDPLYIPIIGFGGAGSRIIDAVERMLSDVKKGPEGHEFTNVITVEINTKQDYLDDLQAASKVLISDKILGLHQDTNGFVEVGEKLMRNNFETIFGVKGVVNFRNADAVILIGSAAGGMGMGGIKETLNYLTQNYKNIPVYPIVVLPFRMEDRPLWREEVSKLMQIKANFTIINNEQFVNDRKARFIDVLDNINMNVARKVMEIVQRVKTRRQEVFAEFINSIYESKFAENLNQFELEYIRVS